MQWWPPMGSLRYLPIWILWYWLMFGHLMPWFYPSAINWTNQCTCWNYLVVMKKDALDFKLTFDKFWFKEILHAFSHFKFTFGKFWFFGLKNQTRPPTAIDLRQKVKNHYSLFTIHWLLFTDYYSLFIVHRYWSLRFLCLFKGGCPLC